MRSLLTLLFLLLSTPIWAQSVVTKTGTIDATNESVVLTPGARSSFSIQLVSNSFSGTVGFDVTNGGGGNWVDWLVKAAGTTSTATTATGSGVWTGSGSFGQVRVFGNSVSSGSIDVYILASPAGGGGGTASGGGDASAANQTTMISHLSDIDDQTASISSNLGDAGVEDTAAPDNAPHMGLVYKAYDRTAWTTGTSTEGRTQLVAGSNYGVIPVTQISFDGSYTPECLRERPISFVIDQTTDETLITGTAGERIHICSLVLNSAAAETMAIVSGTETTTPCDTSTSNVLLGGTTAATGISLVAGGGLVLPPADHAWGYTDTDADNVCLLASGTGQKSGNGTYISIAE